MIQRAAVFILLLTASLFACARDLPLDRIRLPPGFTISTVGCGDNRIVRD